MEDEDDDEAVEDEDKTGAEEDVDDVTGNKIEVVEVDDNDDEADKAEEEEDDADDKKTGVTDVSEGENDIGAGLYEGGDEIVVDTAATAAAGIDDD